MILNGALSCPTRDNLLYRAIGSRHFFARAAWSVKIQILAKIARNLCTHILGSPTPAFFPTCAGAPPHKFRTISAHFYMPPHIFRTNLLGAVGFAQFSRAHGLFSKSASAQAMSVRVFCRTTWDVGNFTWNFLRPFPENYRMEVGGSICKNSALVGENSACKSLLGFLHISWYFGLIWVTECNILHTCYASCQQRLSCHLLHLDLGVPDVVMHNLPCQLSQPSFINAMDQCQSVSIIIKNPNFRAIFGEERTWATAI